MLVRVGLVFFGVIGGLACLVAMELVLYLAGVGEGTPAYDPFSGFSASVPLLEPAERADGTRIHRVSHARLVNSPNVGGSPEREFLGEKPSNGFRAFVVGGSSRRGATSHGFCST